MRWGRWFLVLVFVLVLFAGQVAFAQPEAETQPETQLEVETQPEAEMQPEIQPEAETELELGTGGSVEEDVLGDEETDPAPEYVDEPVGSGGTVVPLAVYDEPYDGSISSSIVTYFTNLLPKLGDVDYVLFRESRYVYRLCYSNNNGLLYDSGFHGDVDFVRYDTSSTVDNLPEVTLGHDSSFSLGHPNMAVYSNLGFFPSLTPAVTSLQVDSLLLLLMVWGLISFCLPFFGYGLRPRGVPKGGVK